MSRSVTFAPEFEAADEEYDDDNYGGYHHDPSQQQAPDGDAADHSFLDQKLPARKDQSTPSSLLNNNSSSSIFCPNCGSREIEQQEASGASVCMDCGVVVEENAIVSAVEFAEGAGGSTTMIGQFVSATSSKAFTGGGSGSMRGGRFGFSRDSRETTLANGRRRILEIGSRLRLGGHFVDAAHRLFTIAVEKNFIQGRRTTHVVAACLYIVCRQEKSQHMLIDFSDALQVNVYTLGTCFLKFRRLLGLKLELIDPALYVYRFAAHLELDELANTVSLTALRLVARMKRDWIVAGRRPAGICAAALLIASRAHGFSKHHQDVTRILRVCGMTVTNRVREFELTPAASLTLGQFHDIDLEGEADPPAYSRNRIMEARVKAIQDGNTSLLMSGALDDPREGMQKATLYRSTPGKMSQRKEKFNELYSTLEKELIGGQEQDVTGTNSDTSGVERPEDNVNEKGGGGELSVRTSEAPASDQPVELVAGNVKTLSKELHRAHPKDAKGKLMILSDQATKEELQSPVAPVETRFSLSEWKAEMPESMESEMEDLFRSDEEEQQKEAIFNKINKEYLEQQQRKESLKQSEEAETEADGDEDGRPRRPGRPRKRKQGDGEDNGADAMEGTSTESQLRAAMANRKVSRKINYDALSSIFDEDGSLGNMTTEDRGNTADGGDDALFDF